MSFRNKILLINATLFLVFVGLFVYGTVQYVKGSYNNQLESIKSGIIGQNTRLYETFLKSQDALMEENAGFILEEVKYLSLAFEHSCVKGYPMLSLIGQNLKCVNDIATDYIKSVSFVDSAKDIEISLNSDSGTSIKKHMANYTSLWSSDQTFNYKIVADNVIKKFYIIQPIYNNPEILLKFELDLAIFAKSLSFEGLDSQQYRFLLIDDEGNFVASNWAKSFNYYHQAVLTLGEETISLKDYLKSENKNT
ncbi:hybrid sensor histidine kinase/response regulator, partial [Vibrio owensii]